MADSRSVRSIGSTRQLGSVRLLAEELVAGKQPELARRVSSLLEVLAQPGGSTPARGGERSLELWLVEVPPRGPGEPPPTPHEKQADAAVRRALELMGQEVTRRWTVAALAKAVGLSRAAFARRFGAALGVSPIAHLTQLRLERAARRLAEGEASLVEVANEVGYASEFAFSRAFKRLYGVPPATFRRRERALPTPAASPLQVDVTRPPELVRAPRSLELRRVVTPPRCLALAA
jgi:transcriptional regulator GlxA family with amidase domain